MKIAPLDLANTPGIYYALTYGISALIFIFLNKRKKETVKWAVTFAVLWLFLLFFMLVTYRIRVELFLPSVLLESAIVLLMIRSGCDMSLKNCVYFTVQAFILGEFAASFEWQIFYFELTQVGLPLRMSLNIITLLAAHGTVFTIFWILQRPYRDGNRLLNISAKEMWTVLFTGIAIYALSNVSYVLKNTPFSEGS